MMNRVKYQKELDALLGLRVAVNKATNEPVWCDCITCERCLMYEEYDKEHDCWKLFRKWLDAEYVAPKKTVKASELAIDTVVLCKDRPSDPPSKRYFATLFNGKLYTFEGGETSKYTDYIIYWQHMELEDGTVVLPE